MKVRSRPQRLPSLDLLLSKLKDSDERQTRSPEGYTSVIATCVQAGVNALDYLVAVQDHRQEVFANPSTWLPWNYEAALVPS